MFAIFGKTWRITTLIAAATLFQLSFAAAHAEDDPPSRVARLNYLDGTVTFSPAGTDDWSSATLNRPLTIGDRVWADKGARSELHVGSTAMRLGANTSLEILDLSDQQSQLKVTQGTFAIRVRNLDPDENIEIDTPNIAFVISEPGDYRFDVDPDRDTTTATVRRGSGRAYGSHADSRPVQMTGNRQLTFSGDDLFYSASGDAPPRDSFDRWTAQRDDRENNARSVRYVSRDMTGYEDLDDNGEWRDAPDYGPVWVPHVTIRDWAPYHYGHWAWVAPWGWTWVDDENWGFAPFHYGRWARIDDYWAWVPGPISRRPVYAPALVGFVGSGGGRDGTHWSVSLSVGVPGVAWFALAPGEHYRPAYTSNPAYITNINRTVVVNKTVINNNVYINQRVPNAIAAMPATDFVRGQSARDHRQDVREDRLREFSKMPVASSLPVAPVRQSVAGGNPAGDSRAARAAPPPRSEDRGFVARRQAPEAPALHDNLARKFADQKGTVPGAGPVFTPTVRPDRGNPARTDRDRAADPGKRAVPDERSPAGEPQRRDAQRAEPPVGNAERRPAPADVPKPPAMGGRAAPPDRTRDEDRTRQERQGEQAPAAVKPDVPRPPANGSQRRDSVVIEPAPGNAEKRPAPVETPKPAAIEIRPQPADRARDEDRMRQERQRSDRPMEPPAAAARPEVPRPPASEGQRRDAVRIEPPQRNVERPAAPAELPRPAAVEARPIPADRTREGQRVVQEPPHRERPVEQAPAPRPAPARAEPPPSQQPERKPEKKEERKQDRKDEHREDGKTQ